MIDLIKIRHDLHQIPELGFEEFSTQEYILNIISKYRCKIKTIGTGIIAFFDNKQSSTLIYRCEMDALKIKEENNIPYRSTNNNMHACAHDAHMSLAIGLCDYLNTHNNFKENIAILFQPSEEGYGGSKKIIESNYLDEINTSKIIAIHFFPKLEKGVFFTSKVIFGSAREININIKSKNIHVANKCDLTDPLIISSKIISRLTRLSNRNQLIHFGIINAGETRNSLAASSLIYGTIRSKKDDSQLIKKIEKIINSIKKRYRINIKCDTSNYLPMINNDNKLINKAKKVIPLKVLNHTFFQGEDFSLYSNKYQSLYLLYGIGEVNYLHTSTFNFDDQLLLSCYKQLVNLIKIN